MHRSIRCRCTKYDLFCHPRNDQRFPRRAPAVLTADFHRLYQITFLPLDPCVSAAQPAILLFGIGPKTVSNCHRPTNRIRPNPQKTNNGKISKRTRIAH